MSNRHANMPNLTPEAGDQEHHDAEMRSQRRLLSDKHGTPRNVKNDVARMQVQREGGHAGCAELVADVGG